MVGPMWDPHVILTPLFFLLSPHLPSSLSLLLSPGATTNGGREKGRRMEEIQLALEATVRPIRANVFRAHARMALAADSVHRWQRRH